MRGFDPTSWIDQLPETMACGSWPGIMAQNIYQDIFGPRVGFRVNSGNSISGFPSRYPLGRDRISAPFPFHGSSALSCDRLITITREYPDGSWRVVHTSGHRKLTSQLMEVTSPHPRSDDVDLKRERVAPGPLRISEPVRGLSSHRADHSAVPVSRQQDGIPHTIIPPFRVTEIAASSIIRSAPTTTAHHSWNATVRRNSGRFRFLPNPRPV